MCSSDLVLPLENELDIASELILGLSGYGEWRMGLAALDRLQSRRSSAEQTAKLWMALGNIFSRRLNALTFMSAEMREPGVVIIRRGLIVDEHLLRAYLEGQAVLFHDLACAAIQRLKPHLFHCYDVTGDDRDTVIFMVEHILEHVRGGGGRMAMLLPTIILHELNRFVADHRNEKT